MQPLAEHPELDPTALALTVLAAGPNAVRLVLSQAAPGVLRGELERRAVADAEAARSVAGRRGAVDVLLRESRSV